MFAERHTIFNVESNAGMFSRFEIQAHSGAGIHNDIVSSSVTGSVRSRNSERFCRSYLIACNESAAFEIQGYIVCLSVENGAVAEQNVFNRI